MTSNADEPLDRIRRLYEESLDTHGVSSPGVGWPDAAAHQLRFEQLATLISTGTDPYSVNDLGTGYGAFATFLADRVPTMSLFRGYDISERMIEHARALVPDGEFHVGGLLDEPADYAFACGIFNVRFDTVEGAWLEHIETTLNNLHEYSTRGFAFNLLTTYVDFREPHLYYGDPLMFFDLCKRRYSPRVALIHDYPLFEWTITVRK